MFSCISYFHDVPQFVISNCRGVSEVARSSWPKTLGCCKHQWPLYVCIQSVSFLGFDINSRTSCFVTAHPSVSFWFFLIRYLWMSSLKRCFSRLILSLKDEIISAFLDIILNDRDWGITWIVPSFCRAPAVIMDDMFHDELTKLASTWAVILKNTVDKQNLGRPYQSS